jgi:hypothetical protein
VFEVSEMVWEEVACAGAFPGDPVEPRQRSLLQIASRYIGNRFTEMPSYGGKSQHHPGFRRTLLGRSAVGKARVRNC